MTTTARTLRQQLRQVREKAAESLASLCKGDRLAKALAKNLTPMLHGS